MWQQDHQYAVRNGLLSEKNLSNVATTAESRRRRVKLQDVRDKEDSQSLQVTNFNKVTDDLKQKLQMAYRKIDDLGLKSLEDHSHSAGRLTSTSVEVETLLADRRRLRLKVDIASMMLISTKSKLQNLYTVLLSRKKIMNLKIARVRALIMSETSPTDLDSVVDEDEVDAANGHCIPKFLDYDRRNGLSLPRSNAQDFDEEEESGDDFTVANSKTEMISANDDYISKSLDDLFLLLNIRLKELENCVTSNTVEIKMLQSIIISSNDHVARQRHEITSLKSQLKSSRI